MIFEVGKHYKNTKGEYVVLAIAGNTMNVRYLDGQEQTLTIETQTRIQENRILTQALAQKGVSRLRRRVSYGSRDYWTLGFLLARLSRLGLNVIFGKEETAKRDYFNVTGEELDIEQVGISCLREGANQWSHQGVITFQVSVSELPFLKFKGKPYPIPSSSDVYEVKDIGYVRFMWEHGFRMGSGGSQDQDKIVSSVSSIGKDAFNKGYNYAQR